MTESPDLSLKVIELCSFAAGPYCTRLLADFGAEVTKIERPGVGDAARRRGPFPQDRPDPEQSGLFLYLNSDKRGVTLDVTTADGQEIFKRLVREADVLVEDWAPGALECLGLGYEALHALNPSLIVTSITAFGQDGPYRDFKSYHLNTYHASGAGYMLPMNSTSFEREPVRGPGFLGEYDGGISAALATLAALFWRRRSGRGQHIDVSKQQSMMHLERSQLRRFIDTGISPNRTGMGRLLEALVECKGGDYAILILSSEKQWQGLFQAMGCPEWGTKEPFNTQAGRSAHYPELKDRLTQWTKDYTAQEIFEKVQSYKSACAPAYTAEEFFQSPQIVERNYLSEIDHTVAGRLQYPGLPYKFSGVCRKQRQPAPLLGEHNELVYGGRLGLSQVELVELKQSGVI